MRRWIERDIPHKLQRFSWRFSWLYFNKVHTWKYWIGLDEHSENILKSMQLDMFVAVWRRPSSPPEHKQKIPFVEILITTGYPPWMNAYKMWINNRLKLMFVFKRVMGQTNHKLAWSSDSWWQWYFFCALSYSQFIIRSNLSLILGFKGDSPRDFECGILRAW